MTSTVIDTWQKFAKVTIETDDLDPSYIFLKRARELKGESWACRFVIHFLCFYDLGGAVKAADQTTDSSFWDYTIANFHAFPRGTERRHSRGDIGLGYITNLSQHGSPTRIWGMMQAPTYTDLVRTFNYGFKGCGFGPYFIWKVLDLQERVWGRKISLSLEEAVRYCPDEPRRCATFLWPEERFSEVMTKVALYVSNFPAPNGGRPCSYQEAETVLCMLKGYFITKTHTIGDDVDEKHNQLYRWPELQALLPPKQDWRQYERGTLVAS